MRQVFREADDENDDEGGEGDAFLLLAVRGDLRAQAQNDRVNAEQGKERREPEKWATLGLFSNKRMFFFNLFLVNIQVNKTETEK